MGVGGGDFQDFYMLLWVQAVLWLVLKYLMMVGTCLAAMLPNGFCGASVDNAFMLVFALREFCFVPS